MASSMSSPSLAPLLHGVRRNVAPKVRKTRIMASEETGGKLPIRRKNWTPMPGVDTRIHWENEDEGWIGGPTRPLTTVVSGISGDAYSDEWFKDLIGVSPDSYYRSLGVSPKASAEEIKAAFRRVAKECHPDATSLSVAAAANKFTLITEAYNVLINYERRKFYDQALAQEVEAHREEKMRLRLEDPREQEVRNWVPVPDMVDRLGGKNMELSGMAVTALSFDVVGVLFAMCCLIYVGLVKDPYC